MGNVRVSYGRNSAGALEITDANDYYPFGMNHLKTGNAFFGRGSYKDNKYNGKELQETGMYSYGWREYMPDIARWNGIDQLAEAYSSTSTYAYVANNPISNLDVDGRWFNDDGSIGQGPATWGLHGSQYKPMMSFSTNDGMHTNEGTGVQYTPFGNTQAYTDLMYAFHNGGTVGVSNNEGALRWWTDYDDSDPNVTGIGVLGILKFKDKGLTKTFSTHEPNFFGNFLEGAIHADKSNFNAVSAWTGYAGFYTLKYEKLMHYTAKISSNWANRASALKGAKGFAIAGKGLGVLGVGFSALEDYQQNGKLGVGTVVKVGIGLATTFAAGALAPWALGYVIADLTVGIVTGTTITDRIAAGVENTIIGRLNN